MTIKQGSPILPDKHQSDHNFSIWIMILKSVWLPNEKWPDDWKIEHKAQPFTRNYYTQVKQQQQLRNITRHNVNGLGFRRYKVAHQVQEASQSNVLFRVVSPIFHKYYIDIVVMKQLPGNNFFISSPSRSLASVYHNESHPLFNSFAS